MWGTLSNGVAPMTDQFSLQNDRVEWRHHWGPMPDGLPLGPRDDEGVMRAQFREMPQGFSIRLLTFRFIRDSQKVHVTPFILRIKDNEILSWSPDPQDFIRRLQIEWDQEPSWTQSVERCALEILDELLGSLFPFLDDVSDAMARVERDTLTLPQSQALADRIFSLRHQILQARRQMASERDAILRLVRYWSTHPSSSAFYGVDIYDQMLRVFDTVDTYREMMTSIVDLYMSSVSNRLNEVVKTLTLATTVLLPGSLVAALYGMNFDELPFSHHRYGFYGVLALIVIIAGFLLWLFRRRRWL